MTGCSALSPELIAVLRVVQFGTRPSCCITIRNTAPLTGDGLRTRTDGCVIGDHVGLQAVLLHLLAELLCLTRLVGLLPCSGGCAVGEHLGLPAVGCITSWGTNALPDCLAFLDVMKAALLVTTPSTNHTWSPHTGWRRWTLSLRRKKTPRNTARVASSTVVYIANNANTTHCIVDDRQTTIHHLTMVFVTSLSGPGHKRDTVHFERKRQTEDAKVNRSLTKYTWV